MYLHQPRRQPPDLVYSCGRFSFLQSSICAVRMLTQSCSHPVTDGARPTSTRYRWGVLTSLSTGWQLRIKYHAIDYVPKTVSRFIRGQASALPKLSMCVCPMLLRHNRPVLERIREGHGQPAHVLVHEVHPEESEAGKRRPTGRGDKKGGDIGLRFRALAWAIARSL